MSQRDAGHALQVRNSKKKEFDVLNTTVGHDSVKADPVVI